MSNVHDLVIFEKALDTGVDDGGMYIALETTTQNTIQIEINPLDISISEELSFATFFITLTFIDGNGVYAAVEKLNPADVYYLHFGLNIETATRTPVSIWSVKQEPRQFGLIEDVETTITFVHSGWFNMMGKRHNRAFGTPNEAVKTMLTECGFKKIAVGNPFNSYGAVIQPYWSNAHTIRWIQEKCGDVNTGDHFELGVKVDNTAFFRTPSDIMEEKYEVIKRGEIPVLMVSSDHPDIATRDEERAENDGVTVSVQRLSMDHEYADNLLNGSGGTRSMHFDFMSGRFENTVQTQNSTNAKQLADWSNVRAEHNGIGCRVYGGSSIGTPFAAQARVSGTAMTSSVITATTSLNGGLHIGDIVELVIPLNPENYSQLSATLHAGFYMIGSVVHQIDGQTGSTLSHFSLIRKGFDSTEAKGYIKTNAGKVLRKSDVRK